MTAADGREATATARRASVGRLILLVAWSAVACGQPESSSREADYIEAVDALCVLAVDTCSPDDPQKTLQADLHACRGAWEDLFIDLDEGCEAASVEYVACAAGLTCDAHHEWNLGEGDHCEEEATSWYICFSRDLRERYP